MKPIQEYENNYLIDKEGNIFSKPRCGTVSYLKKIKSHINRFGYKQVVLMKENKMRTLLVHRLVAKAFIENPFGLEQVNHIDGNKANNNVSNLEWCSNKYNTQHAFNKNLNNFKDRALEQIKKINDTKSYKRVELKKDGKTLVFGSTKDAGLFLNTNKDNISRAYNKGQKCKGYNVFCFRTANGETLPSNVEGNPVGNS